jgi:hypothetical protein
MDTGRDRGTRRRVLLQRRVDLRHDLLLPRPRLQLGGRLRGVEYGVRDDAGAANTDADAYTHWVRGHAHTLAHSDAHAHAGCRHADSHAHSEPYCDSVNGTRRSDGAGRDGVGIKHHADLERVDRGDELHGAQVELHFVVRLSRDDSFDDVHGLGSDSEDVLLHRRRDVLDRELRAESMGFRDGPGRIANGHAYADSVRWHADSHAHADADSDSHCDAACCHADRHADSDAHAHAGCGHPDAHADADSRFDSSGAFGPDRDRGFGEPDQPDLG